MHETHNHHHHNAAELKRKPLFLAIFLNLLITVAQIIGGLLSGSLALLGDALHNFSDVLSLILSFIANKLSGQGQIYTKTFGYKRAQILAAFINALALIGVSVYLIFEAVQRLFATQLILTNYVIWLALAGILVNGGSAFLLIKMQKGDSNLRAAYLHLLGDLVTSFAVLAGGLAMHFYGIFWVDGAITILVSFYLIYTATKLLLHTTNVLMQFVPEHLHVAKICTRLETEPQVLSLHHVHVWQINDDVIHFEAHIVVRENLKISDFEILNHRLAHILEADFGISHVVLQPEFTGSCNDAVIHQE